MRPDEYVETTGHRLSKAGYEVTTREVDGQLWVIGHRADFRWRWVGTYLHTFVVVATVEASLSAAALETYANRTLDYAISAKGRFRGLQTGVGTLAVVVANDVEPAAATYADSTRIARWAAYSWPVAVDLGAGRRCSFSGTRKVGRIYEAWMRQQVETVLPIRTGQ